MSKMSAIRAPSAYARMVLKLSDQPAEVLLADTGLSNEMLDTNDFMSAEQQLKILENAIKAETSDGWIFNFARAIGVGSHGPISFAALSAPSLGAGLDVYISFTSMRAPFMEWESHVEDDRYCISIEELIDLDDLRPYIHELSILVLQTYIEQVLGRPIREGKVSFGFKRPRHVRRLSEHISAKISFDQSLPTTLSIPLSWKNIRGPLYDEKMYLRSLAECKEQFAASTSNATLTSKISNLLSAHFDRFVSDSLDNPLFPRLEDIAAAFHMTARTLNRKLQSENTSYRVLLEQQKKEAALFLLDSAKYRIADVANLLTYGDAANFGRAFKKWYGISPGLYRRQRN